MATVKPRKKVVRKAKAPQGRVVALQRGLEVLACFEPHNRPLSHADLARTTRVPKPTLTRLVNTLLALGFLRIDAHSEKYSLGPRLVALSSAYVGSFDVRSVARPLMQDLAVETGLSVYLAIASDLDMMIIEACRSRTSMLVTRLDIGSRVPISTPALGRAFLMAADEATRETLLQRMSATHGEHWTPILHKIEASLRKARKLGYCLSLGELYPDVHSIAKALPTPTGEIVVLNCGGPSTFLTEQRIARVAGPALLATAQALTDAIGQATN